ncbi:hypothetical protein PEDI_44770 [Persicobacter diffluens]|uniref:Uncharacterized protein n=1 Tax=Persicobacter diffluens TaxID=981 RepID=A0AAN5ALG1_9BACT|nr:hypothetical protein PEDI_44770 [Persicobacter diffluens]
MRKKKGLTSVEQAIIAVPKCANVCKKKATHDSATQPK